MVRRKHLLVAFCGFVAATAILLRIWNGVQQSHLVLAAAPANLRTPVNIPAPRDYVLHPDVAPGEEGRGPARIISLAPSITETLCAGAGPGGSCRRPYPVLHVSAADSRQPRARGRWPYGHQSRDDPGIEPDLVLTTSNSGVLGGKLEALGLRQESLPHDSLEDVFTAIERAGALCDRPETARRLVAAIRADLEAP